MGHSRRGGIGNEADFENTGVGGSDDGTGDEHGYGGAECEGAGAAAEEGGSGQSKD